MTHANFSGLIMNRLLTTGVAVSALLATTGLALAQGAINGPYYYGAAPVYGQQMMPPPPPMPGPSQAWVGTPGTDGTHSSGSGDRAYRWGPKTN
jgi:hypothetical protein